MTGKDAILNYLKTHKTCSSPDVAAASGMTHTCINQAANILAKQGVLVAEARCGGRFTTGWPLKKKFQAGRAQTRFSTSVGKARR